MSKKDNALFKEHTAMANRQGYTGACNPEWAKTLTERNYQPSDDHSRFKDLKEALFTFLWSGETLGLTSYEKALRKIKKATEGKFDKMYCSHGGGDLTVDYFDRMLENIAIAIDMARYAEKI